jgi:sulfate adenylyltransferase subunit 2
VNKSLFILREAKARFDNPAILWSTGKDSTAIIGLCLDAFYDEVPFPVVFIDTGFHYPQIIRFRDAVTQCYDLNLVIARNSHALNVFDMNCKTYGYFDCCRTLKTNALMNIVKQNKYDALLLGIRADEHGIRGKERFFSPRDSKWHWRVMRDKTPEEMKEGDAPVKSLTDTELAGWGIYATDFGPDCNHVRVHPILHWEEIDVWNYIKTNGLPVNPLYISKNNKRFRSLGCVPCTDPTTSDARTIDEIIEEVWESTEDERAGRKQTKENNLMERLRYFGYM